MGRKENGEARDIQSIIRARLSMALTAAASSSLESLEQAMDRTKGGLVEVPLLALNRLPRRLSCGSSPL